MMLLIGVKRGVNKLYNDAGDGIGTLNLNNLEASLESGATNGNLNNFHLNSNSGKPTSFTAILGDLLGDFVDRRRRRPTTS